MTPTYSLENEFQQWLKTRPKAVQEFAAKLGFRPGDRFYFPNVPEGSEVDIQPDRMYYLIGYWEDEADGLRIGIMLSDIDPSVLYEAAIDHVFYIGSEHFDGTDAVQLVPEYQVVH